MNNLFKTIIEMLLLSCALLGCNKDPNTGGGDDKLSLQITSADLVYVGSGASNPSRADIKKVICGKSGY